MTIFLLLLHTSYRSHPCRLPGVHRQGFVLIRFRPVESPGSDCHVKVAEEVRLDTFVVPGKAMLPVPRPLRCLKPFVTTVFEDLCLSV